jgi:DNA-binding transcriptional LysR family regulator
LSLDDADTFRTHSSRDVVELRHLRYFVATVEEQSFLRASRRLRVSQPALSKQIRDLEAEVGVQLLERVARGVRLTRAGEAFLDGAKRTLESVSNAVASARAVEGRHATQLKLGRGPFVVYAPYIAELLAAFRMAYPDVDIDVTQISDPDAWPALRDRRIDAALTLVQSEFVAGFEVFPILDCSATGVLLPASHALVSKAVVELRELRELTHLFLPTDSWPELSRAHEAGLRERGLVPANRRPWTGPEAWQIAAGDGWTLANEMVAQRYAADVPSIAYRPFSDPPIAAWLALAWPCERASPLMPMLVAVARQCAYSWREGRATANV